jgi:hypothetical protein
MTPKVDLAKPRLRGLSPDSQTTVHQKIEGPALAAAPFG